ncbi:hypothetical protein PVAND_016057 [Polypedilum vanderplanki]|uniref:Uncharacterized protein n=1 Tax=Polypedilum vanderplanki TaxID=319348 RepID=A0A9J6BEQ9_POLVA|nr:hypothetical protein PVAND_016057 [Polypedilum vanderplanki]
MSEHAEQSSEQSGRMPVAYRHSCPVFELDDFAGLEKPKEKPKPSEKEAQKFPSLYSRSALVTVRKEVDKETLTKVHNNLNGIPCADCGLLYKPNKLEKHRMEKHNKH